MTASALILVDLLLDTIVVLGFLLIEAHIILSWIFSMLFTDFKTGKLRSITTPPVEILTGFFHADADRNVHSLPELWYLSLFLFWFHLTLFASNPSEGGVMVKALDCRIVVSEFKFQSCYYVYFRTNTFGKGMNTLIFLAMG